MGLRKIKYQSANWRPCNFYVEAGYTLKVLCHLLPSAEGAEVGHGAQGPSWVSLLCPSLSLKLSGQERSISRI